MEYLCFIPPFPRTLLPWGSPQQSNSHLKIMTQKFFTYCFGKDPGPFNPKMLVTNNLYNTFTKAMPFKPRKKVTKNSSRLVLQRIPPF